MDDEGTAVVVAKWLFAAEHGCFPEEADAVLADPRLALPAAGIAEALARRWVPFARAALAAIPAAGVATPVAPTPTGTPGG